MLYNSNIPLSKQSEMKEHNNHECCGGGPKYEAAKGFRGNKRLLF